MVGSWGRSVTPRIRVTIHSSRSYPTVQSIHKNVDIVFVRELSEDMLYSESVVAGPPEFRPNGKITLAMRVITRSGSSRVAREAFEIARTRRRKKVTAAHKEPVYRLACACSLRNAAGSRMHIPAWLMRRP